MGRGVFLRSLTTMDTQREGYTQDSKARTEKTALTRHDRRGHAHTPHPQTGVRDPQPPPGSRGS